MNPNRIKFTDENTGITYTGTWAYADNPVVDGTLMNKAAFLQDATATAIGLTQEDPTVNDALAKLQTNINTKMNSNKAGAASGIATLNASTKVTAEQASSATSWVTANLTLGLNHSGLLIYLSSSSPITVTIPTNDTVAFPIGTEIEFCRFSTGTVTFAGAGVSILSVNSKKNINHQYGFACLKKQNTNTWILAGDLG